MTGKDGPPDSVARTYRCVISACAACPHYCALSRVCTQGPMSRNFSGQGKVAPKRQTRCPFPGAQAGNRYFRFSRTSKYSPERADRGRRAVVSNRRRESRRNNLPEQAPESIQLIQRRPQSARCLERCFDQHAAILEYSQRARIARIHHSRSSEIPLATAPPSRTPRTPLPDLSSDGRSGCRGLRQSCRRGTAVLRHAPELRERRHWDAVRS
jgi:hypothetical protein